MNNETPPPNPVTFRGIEFKLEDDLTVSSPRPSGKQNDILIRMDRLSVHGDVMRWLSDHALWLDRSEEIALAAIARYQVEPFLRGQLNLTAPDFEWEPPWLHIADMPRIPALAVRILHARGVPAVMRWLARKRLSDYQRSHAGWMATEVERCAELRERLRERYSVDRKFDDARRNLQMTFDRGTPEDTDRARATTTEVIRNLSDALVVSHFEFHGTDELEIDVVVAGTDVIGQKRHMPRDNPFHLEVLESATVGTDRVEMLGYVIALTIADLAGLLRTARRTIRLRLLHRRDGEDGRISFSSHFHTDQILASGDRIADAVARRERPEISGWNVKTPHADGMENQT